jgi:hypothetical protein
MKRKVVGVIFALAIALLVIGFILWHGNSSKQILADGTVIVLSRVQVGRTNFFTHGTWLSKTVGRFAPSNGVAVAGLKILHPTKLTFWGPPECEVLSAQFRLLPGSPRQAALVAPQFFRKYRWLISGDDDFAFVIEFRGFEKDADGLFSYINAYSFPRDSKLLHFRLEARESTGNRDFREVATFVVRNPKPARVEIWKADQSPHFKLADDLEMDVGELIVRHEPIHPTDIWEYTAYLPTRIIRHGQATTNWGLMDSNVHDASGNFVGVPANKVITNGWMVNRMHVPADPAKLWKFQLHFGLETNFPAINLYSITVPFPMPGLLQTNLGGFPCQIDWMNQNMIQIKLVNKPAGMRLTFVSAFDENGANLDGGAGGWSHIMQRNS